MHTGQLMRLFGTSALLFMLAACGTSYPYQEKRIQVETLTESFTVPFAKSQSGLTPDGKSELQRLTKQIRGTAVKSVTVQANRASKLSMSRAGTIKSNLIRAGFPTQVFHIEPVRTVSQDVTVDVAYALAHAPENCPDWRSRATPNYSNQQFSNFRCTTMTNLARQVSDPEDLIHGNNSVSGDADRNQVAITNYKQNTVTAPIISVGGQ